MRGAKLCPLILDNIIRHEKRPDSPRANGRKNVFLPKTPVIQIRFFRISRRFFYKISFFAQFFFKEKI